ncbi:MAG TPA: acyl-ACP--UDP-N-acetylglucosamine O-acyltransferase [Gemmatimonadales bacterium]|nr:acyl-ACP--UDP-N-acetylglucosamine O-acyltransferase [Gemmatimonadales bacterium]
MSASVHPTAIVDPGAEIGDGTVVGAGVIIGPGVKVGRGCRLDPRSVLERNVTLGDNVRVGIGSIIGGDPQDLKWAGEETTVSIGDGTVVREYATINRGTAQSWSTTIGRNCLVMTTVHVGHDCHIGDGVILSNGVGLAGHVHIDERAIIGGMSGVHQFVHIGAHAFVGGLCKLNKDVPPYVKVDGNPARLYGLNSIGLQRNGFPPDTLESLKKAYRLFFRSGLNIGQALERWREELPQSPEVERFVRFIEDSERGVLV